MKIIIQDPGIKEDLRTLFTRTGQAVQIISTRKQGKFYNLTLRKGGNNEV